ncbi:hypothetical protein [Clostridium sp. C2-6-12]|uniref:hypothetical protein n=1 Tax=Clostridium sp. C2-6-12 TaxID=2698832 RepID=UPI001369ECF7|nr:hypothetical protein [Clostridium sp. C2-6-12]
MKRNKIFHTIYLLTLFLSFVLTFYIGFEIIKLKHTIFNYIILVIASGCLESLGINIYKSKRKMIKDGKDFRWIKL